MTTTVAVVYPATQPRGWNGHTYHVGVWNDTGLVAACNPNMHLNHAGSMPAIAVQSVICKRCPS